MCGEMINMHKILVCIPEGKRPLREILYFVDRASCYDSW